MFRSISCALLALGLVLAFGTDYAQAAKNQMVKGTIKSANPDTDVLVVNQKVGTGTVDRELSITKDAEFTIKTPKETFQVSGKEGLKLLVGAEGATVQVKCDKDVNVISVTVTISK